MEQNRGENGDLLPPRPKEQIHRTSHPRGALSGEQDQVLARLLWQPRLSLHVRMEEQSKAARWGTGTRQVAEEQANILSYPASCPAIRGKTGDGRGHTGITHFYIHTRLGSQGNASQVQGEENTANSSCSIMLNTGEIHGEFPTTQTHCLLFIQCLAWNEKSESMQRPALQSTFRPQNVLQPYFPRLWRLGYCLN